MTTYLIVGDGVAGHTAAETIREQDEGAEIHVFTEENVPFYDRIGLRAYIREGRDREDLILNGEDWYAEQDIALHLETRIAAVDRDAQTVTDADGTTYEYDALLLATGGTPREFPGAEQFEQTHHLWYLEGEADPLREDLMDAEHGVVIGGGLLGFDLVGSFSETDTETTYLIREENWWPRVLTPKGASLIHDAMREHGINLHLEEEAAAFEQQGDRVRITTNKDAYTADVAGIAIGNIANITLANDAGIDTDRGIVTDEYLQTSDEHIFAAGTVAEYNDVVLEQTNMAGSWVTAQEQGRVAGTNMVNHIEDESLEQLAFVDTYTVMHFGLNVASLGSPATGDDQDMLELLDEEHQRYRKLVLEQTAEKTRIVGAAIIGEMKWLYPLKQLIKNKVDVSNHIEDLEDPEFDLNKLL